MPINPKGLKMFGEKTFIAFDKIETVQWTDMM
jgi:hypothetical protein